MGGDNMQVRRAKSGIYDAYRGVFLNRGVFVKAPPGFFAAYPSEFEAPPTGYEKLNVHLRTIQNWDKEKGLLKPPEPKLEIPPPAGPMVGLAVSEPSAASEPVAASDNAQPSTPEEPAKAMSSSPAGDKPKKPTRGRTVKIK